MMESPKKRVTFGDDQIIHVENVSGYFDPNPLSFFNVLEYHFNSLSNVEKMPYDKENKLQEMARICYLISNNKSIKRVSFTLAKKCSNEYFQNVVTMLQCGFNSNEIDCEYSLDRKNSICFYDESIHISVDDNFTIT